MAAALNTLGIKRVALGTPYSEEITLKGKAHLEGSGFEVVSYGRLKNVTDIYAETPERAYQLGRSVDSPEAQAVFLSRTGMPTIQILDVLEQDLGKPVLSGLVFGHTKEKATLPMGVAAELDAGAKKVTIVEAATVA